MALSGGPIIRSTIDLLRGLQTRINEQGSISPAKLDLDVQVSVSFGYAAHQVDDFALEGLLSTALERLSIDASSRSPFAVDTLLPRDIRPEDIIGEPSAPMTTVDIAARLRADADGEQAAFITKVSPVIDLDTATTPAVLLSLGWRYTLGHVQLAEPQAFLAMANRQPELASIAAGIAFEAVREAIDEADAAGRPDLFVMVELPEILLHPEAGALALPNLVVRALDRRQASRTVVIVDTIPQGSGQALRTLGDRGLHIAVTAAAAAGADPTDLYGWHRWAVLLHRTLLAGPAGIDALTIQQTMSAIAGSGTHLIGEVSGRIDQRQLAEHNIEWIVGVDEAYDGVTASLEALVSERRD